MPRQTDYIGLTVPTPADISDEDEGEWAGILNNQTFDGGIDELLMARGPLANRPAASSGGAQEGRMWLLTGGSDGPTPTYFDGTNWNGINATTLGGLQRGQFASHRRTFFINSQNNTSDERIKIGKISNNTADGRGKFDATLINAVSVGSLFAPTMTMHCGVDNSQSDISHYYYGKGASNDDAEVGLVVTETNGTGPDGENEYYLYVDPATDSISNLIIDYVIGFESFDFTPGLTTADYIGSPIYNTADQPPDMDVGYGEVDTSRLSGPLTGGVDVDTLAGSNLDVVNGDLQATDTRTDVSDDGAVIVQETTDINFGVDLDATDDGDGTVTVDATGTAADTRTDVSDDGATVVQEVSDINFADDLDAIDDGDGTVTINSLAASTDTRTDVSDNGSTVVTDTIDINFDNDLTVIDDGDGSATVNSTVSGTKTTLFLSDYTNSGPGADDSGFESAVADADPGDTIIFDNDNYTFDMSHEINKTLTIKGVNSTLEYTNTANNNAAILFNGTGREANTTLSAARSRGRRIIPVNDTSIFSPEDTVLIISQQYSGSVNAKIHFSRVETVDSSAGEILIDGGVSSDFASGDFIYRVGMLEDPTIEGLETHGGGNRHFQFHWCENPTFRDVKVSEYLEVSLYTLDCWKPRYYNVEARAPTGVAGGEGEPVASYRCGDGYMESVRIYRCRRGIDFAWGSYNFTIIDPVIRAVDLVGIGIHQNDIGGTFTIQGGSIACTPKSFSGHCIAFSSSATVFVEGTYLVPRETGVIASGETHISDVTVNPTAINAGDPAIGAFRITSSDVHIENVVVKDPDGAFSIPIWVDTSEGFIEHVDINASVYSPSGNHVMIDSRGERVNDIKVSGYFDNLNGSAGQCIFIRGENGNSIDNIDISANIETFPSQGVRIYSIDNSRVDSVTIHECFMDAGAACVFTDGGSASNFGTIRVCDSTFDTDGGNALHFDEDVEKLFITNNSVDGAIVSSGAGEERIVGNL